MSHPTVQPTWHRHFDPNLGVDRATIIGYRAVGKDGWRGPRRYTWSAAREDLRERRATLTDRVQRTAPS